MRPSLVDPAIVLVALGGGMLEQLAWPLPLHDQIVKGVVIGASVLPLLLRRRFPFLTVVVVASAIFGAGLADVSPGSAGFFALMLATFTGVAESSALLAVVAAALCYAAVTVQLPPWVIPDTIWLPAYVIPAAVIVVGRAQRRRSELARLLDRRLVETQAQRERLHRLALQDARAELARDLHAVVVDAVRRMTTHATEAGRRLERGAAESLLVATEQAGRTALVELRRLLNVLRRTADAEDVRLPVVGDYALPERRRCRPSAWQLDLLLVAALSVTAWREFGPAHEQVRGLTPPSEAFTWHAQAWAIAWVALLLLRRRFPLATAIAVSGMAFGQNAFGFYTPQADIFALQVAVFSLGSRRSRRLDAYLVALLGALGLFVPQPLTASYVGSLVVFALTLLGAAYLGQVVGERERLNVEYQESAAALDEERRTELALSVREDRLRVAREMHDLAGHALSIGIVQAGAARIVAARNTRAAREAIVAVVDAGSTALAELDQLLAHLQEEPASELRHRSVEDLIRQARSAGVDVELEREGTSCPNASVELAAYRIVQEALTNVRKHAAGAHATVRLRYADDAVEVRVESERGATCDLAMSSAGQGLLGMEERVAAFGGRLLAGPCDSGGFVVEAVVPLEGALA